MEITPSQAVSPKGLQMTAIWNCYNITLFQSIRQPLKMLRYSNVHTNCDPSFRFPFVRGDLHLSEVGHSHEDVNHLAVNTK